ncbi:hypothetical protein [Caulobacter phage KSC]|uniref:Uncharacterized protein n=1 Tax=Caulobacter phage KSC TaxID=3020398 RepID=A0AAE9X787_9CAUD|nr:hypothetical protein [Caulobacter phage KSC]
MTPGRYIWNLLIALDQLLNTLLAGNPDETLSSRAHKASLKGKAWGCILCKLLNFIDKNHCAESVEPDEK